jgi:hypothetical protein
VFGHNGEGRFPFGNSGPWYEFQRTLLNSGATISDEDISNSADFIIANTHNKQIESYMLSHQIPLQNRVLIVWEPKVVDSFRYRPDVISQYGKVFAPSIDWARLTGGTNFNWPQDPITDIEILANWLSRKDSLVLIQGNKFSANKKELYSLRRRVIQKMQANECDLYGTNWNRGLNFDWWHWSRSVINTPLRDFSIKSIYGIGKKVPNYKGEVASKHQTLSNYKICLVIENSADFVSEKLFDAVRAGCITIYVGPNLEKYGIVNSGVIQSVPDANAVYKQYLRISEMPESAKIRLAKKQLKYFVSISQDWDNSNVLSSLAEEILKYFKIKK